MSTFGTVQNLRNPSTVYANAPVPTNVLSSGGIAGITTRDEGVVTGTAAGVNNVNFVGAGVTAVGVGNTTTVTIPGGSGIAGITTQEEGVTTGTAAGVTTLNFVGDGITAVGAGATTTITIPGQNATTANGGISYFIASATTNAVGTTLLTTVPVPLAAKSVSLNVDFSATDTSLAPLYAGSLSETIFAHYFRNNAGELEFAAQTTVSALRLGTLNPGAANLNTPPWNANDIEIFYFVAVADVVNWTLQGSIQWTV